MCSLELANALVRRKRAGHVLEREVLVDGSVIWPDRKVGKAADQRMQLGGERQTAAGRASIKKRLLAGTIACEEQALGARIPQREGEHARQLCDGVGAVVLIEVENYLAVAVGPHRVALANEVFPEVGKIVYLAVDHHPYGSVLVEQRLVRLRTQVDDRETPVPEHGPAVRPKPFGVRPAMDHRRAHATDRTFVWSTCPGNVSTDTAHVTYMAHPGPLHISVATTRSTDGAAGTPIERSPVRVMHVVVGGDIGGAERLLVELATRPEKTDAVHQVALFTPNRALGAFFARAGLRIHDRGPVRENPLAYLVRSLGPADVSWLVARIEEERIDVVHTHTFGSHVLGTRAARHSSRPQLRTEHHVMHYFDPSCSPFTRWAAARTEGFVAVSEYVHSVLTSTAPSVAARCTTVRNGVDTAYWAPREASRRDSSDAGFRVGIVCRLTPWKRVHLAIEAAALAATELVVVGDGELRAGLEKLARKSGALAQFVGHQADPRPFIAQCDAILSTADREPLGLSVLESLAMERPVIALTGGGIPEIVMHGRTGVLVEEPSAMALAAAVTTARRNRSRLREMGVRGRQFAVEHGTIDRTCEGYARAYRALRRSMPNGTQ